MWIDSHAHLDDEAFNGDRGTVIERALAAKVEIIINPGSNAASSRRAIELAERHPGIYAAVGIHPQDAGQANAGDWDLLAEWLVHPKVVAVGEIGLDYYYDLSPRDVQQEALLRQLELARRFQKPVILHDRDAHADIVDIMRRHGQGLAGVFHCFSGSVEMAREVLRMGFYIALGGSVTFKNSVKPKEVAAMVPADRLLVETDCPYLTPVPFRGKRNEPAYVVLAAQEIARLRGIAAEELAAQTSANARRLFGIP